MSNSLNGMPARYLANPPTLADGDATALLVDENGALIVTSGPGVNPIQEEYTVENYTPTRTFDASIADTQDIADFIATLVADMKDAGQIVS